MSFFSVYCSEKIPFKKDAHVSSDLETKEEDTGKYKVRTMTRTKPKSEQGGIFASVDLGKPKKTT
jgi:hypothetical protein